MPLVLVVIIRTIILGVILYLLDAPWWAIAGFACVYHDMKHEVYE